jgi:hypothetical protein
MQCNGAMRNPISRAGFAALVGGPTDLPLKMVHCSLHDWKLVWPDSWVTLVPLLWGFLHGVCHFCILKIDQVMQYNGAMRNPISWAGFACALSRGPTDLPIKLVHCHLHDWKLVWPGSWVTLAPCFKDSYMLCAIFVTLKMIKLCNTMEQCAILFHDQAGFACALSRGPTDLPIKLVHCYLHDWKLVWPNSWATLAPLL